MRRHFFGGFAGSAFNLPPLVIRIGDHEKQLVRPRWDCADRGWNFDGFCFSNLWNTDRLDRVYSNRRGWLDAGADSGSSAEALITIFWAGSEVAHKVGPFGDFSGKAGAGANVGTPLERHKPQGGLAAYAHLIQPMRSEQWHGTRIVAEQ